MADFSVRAGVMQLKNGTFLLGDCLERMSEIPDGSVDMVLCDLPYGTTQNKWDSVIPFEPLWTHYWRVCKPNAAVVLTAQCPFDKALGASQLQHLKYEWIWEKSKATGHLNAKKQPMKAHENALVFYRQKCLYNPQLIEGEPYKARGGKHRDTNYGPYTSQRENNGGQRYPRSVQYFRTAEAEFAGGSTHPTQKPVALFEYLIRTYTSEGMVVLDNCAGSGTAAVAAENTGRKWICIERDPAYYYAACARVLTA
jgi:site-specific DNA-methyltransferase (adenine-specific)